MSKPTDIGRVVGEGECKLDNPLVQTIVDTSIANPNADDADRSLVVESSIGAETQPAPEFFETLEVLTRNTHEFLPGMDLKCMRKSWSSPALVSTSTSQPDGSKRDIIPGRNRIHPYLNTDDGDGDIHSAKRLHVQTYYVCKDHERRKSRFEYEELGILLSTFEALGYESNDDRELTSQIVKRRVDAVFADMSDETMGQYTIFELYR